MLAFLLSLVLASEDSHVPTFWLLPYLGPALLQTFGSSPYRTHSGLGETRTIQVCRLHVKRPIQTHHYEDTHKIFETAILKLVRISSKPALWKPQLHWLESTCSACSQVQAALSTECQPK